jgi:hypothetical protein
VDLSKCELSAAAIEKLHDLILQYSDVFATSNDDLGFTNVVEHRIDTGKARPYRRAPYRTAHQLRPVVEREIDKMTKTGIIRPSCSPWASPIVLVKKKDGTHRFCVDYRGVNKETIRDEYPLKRVDDMLDSMQGARYFATMDLYSGYWQVAMEESSIPKTAFTTHMGLFEFTRMPFGLTNAPATFQRLMEYVLRGLDWRVCLVFIDDIIIPAKTEDELLDRLRQVMDRLRAAGLKVKAKKCCFGMRQVNFVGHIVGNGGILPDPGKIDAIASWPKPSSLDDLRSFLGFAN